jgi:hypothetical protein
MPSGILMVRPAKAGFNDQTSPSNVFQGQASGFELKDVLREFELLARLLSEEGVEVHIQDAPADCPSPDAHFPNNWISFHPQALVLYPMESPLRRTEVNEAFVQKFLTENPGLNLLDLRSHTSRNFFLEGTGSLVFDYDKGFAYAALSSRTHEGLAGDVCRMLGFIPVTFSTNYKNLPVYHTNVLLSIGPSCAVLCDEIIPDSAERAKVKSFLERSGKEIITITADEMAGFCGNVYFLTGNSGPLIAMSEKARRSFRLANLKKIESYGTIVAADIPAIEALGGGSVRCMIAEIRTENED